MPDPLPWLEELLTRRHVSTDSSLAHALRAAITSALSRERAAAVEECAKVCDELAEIAVESPRVEAVTKVWMERVSMSKTIAHRIRSLSALPLEAAATRTEATDEEWHRPFAERPSGYIKVVPWKEIDEPQMVGKNAAGEVACRSCGAAFVPSDVAWYPHSNGWTHECKPTAPLTPAAVREIAIDAVCHPSTITCIVDALQSLGSRINALESRDVRAEIERYIDRAIAAKRAERKPFSEVVLRAAPNLLRSTAACIGQKFGARDLEEIAKAIEAELEEAQRNGE